MAKRYSNIKQAPSSPPFESRTIFTQIKKTPFGALFWRSDFCNACSRRCAISLRLVGPTRRTQKRSFCCHLKLCSLKNMRWQRYALKMLHRSILVAAKLKNTKNEAFRELRKQTTRYATLHAKFIVRLKKLKSVAFRVLRKCTTRRN